MIILNIRLLSLILYNERKYVAYLAIQFYFVKGPFHANR